MFRKKVFKHDFENIIQVSTSWLVNKTIAGVGAAATYQPACYSQDHLIIACAADSFLQLVLQFALLCCLFLPLFENLSNATRPRFSGSMRSFKRLQKHREHHHWPRRWVSVEHANIRATKDLQQSDRHQNFNPGIVSGLHWEKLQSKVFKQICFQLLVCRNLAFRWAPIRELRQGFFVAATENFKRYRTPIKLRSVWNQR